MARGKSELTIQQLVKAQEVALKAINLRGSPAEAIYFLERDLDRWQVELERKWVKVPEYTSTTKTIKNAIQFIKDNPLWDRNVRYDLLPAKALPKLKKDL